MSTRFSELDPRARAFWAKSGEPIGHGLLAHMLDVAAVSEVLLDHESDVVHHWLSNCTGITLQSVPRWTAFLMGLHDFGKAIPGFQDKWPEGRKRDEATGLVFREYRMNLTDHDLASAALLPDYLASLKLSRGFIRGVVQAVSAHHGYNFLATEVRNTVLGDDANWSDARRRLFDEYCSVLQPEGIPSSDELPLEAVEWLAGLTSISDWIGSNVEWFPLGERFDDLREYFENSKLMARRALDVIGWPTFSSLLTSNETIDSLINRVVPTAQGSTPRPLQVEGDRLLSDARGPSLLLVEAPMGEGKTELAFLGLLRLQAANQHRGLYFALPTKATGNAMFERTLEFLRAFAPEINLDIQLVHGSSLLDDRVLQLRGIWGKPSDNITSSAWFSQRRRSLISPYGVGTIDQALLSILNVKHHFVRLWGLANRVVVLDEVHAYDTYTSGLIAVMLRWLKFLGCSVILMSATLPAQRRNELLQAWDVAANDIPDLPYPRLVLADARGARAATFDARSSPSINLSAIEEDESSLADCVLRCLSGGGYGAVILNTVDRAQKLYCLLRGRIEAGTQVILFHARFPADERGECERTVLELFNTNKNIQRAGSALLIATQVAEQSLDIDFDFLITDLAPVDLILQRAGRLHRHQRLRSDAHKDAQLFIAGLHPEKFPKLKETGWEFVYDSYILGRTWAFLSREKVLVLPQDIDRLVQTVYGDDPLPESLSSEIRFSIEGPAYGKYLAKLQAERQLANNAAVDPRPEPQDAYIGKPRANEEGEGWGISSRTRLGNDSINLVPVHIVPNGWSLYPNGIPFNPSVALDEKTTKALFARQFSSSRMEVVKNLSKTDIPASFSEHPLLRDLKPLVLEDGVAEIGSLAVRLDPELGVVYERMVHLNSKERT